MRTELALVPLAALLSAGSPRRAATSGSGLPIADAVMDRQSTGAWIACAGAPERDPGVFRFRKVIELASISVSYRRDGAALEARITLPPGLTGEFAWRGAVRPVKAGEQTIRVEWEGQILNLALRPELTSFGGARGTPP